MATEPTSSPAAPTDPTLEPPSAAGGLPANSSPPGHAGASHSVWETIKRHKVVEWSLAYLAFSYATLHASQLLRETLEWPAVVPRLTLFALLLGLPIVVTLAWYHGHRAQHRVSRTEIAILGILLVIAGSVLWFLGRSSHDRAGALERAGPVTGSPLATAAFAPPPHSIAVLPFVNLSGDKEQEYFSDGLTEELLNSLTQFTELQVAARTSSFSFKEHPDIVTVAHKLNVAAVLEGSVRRTEHTVRVTAQLIDSVTGFHVWSKNYDRDVGDMLKLQTELATAVAQALKVTLLGDVSARIQLGGTRNPAAFDAYLRGSKAYQSRRNSQEIPIAISAYTEAIRLDPDYALAFASRSIALTAYTAEVATGAAIREGFERADADARRAVALASELAQAHLALAFVLENGPLNFAAASQEYERAMALAPGNAEILRVSGHFATVMGNIDAGLTALRQVVVLDPLDRRSHAGLGLALYYARRYREAAAAFTDAISLDSNYKSAYGDRGRALFALGDVQSARVSCEAQRDDWVSQWCLAFVYHRLGRHAEADAELAKLKASDGDEAAYQYATIYSQWGDHGKALEWLETAMRLRDSGLENLKADPLFDPLREEPRFQAVERQLKFPD
jgi:TolB-like protein/Tfp pilus assembly protein PilF